MKKSLPPHIQNAERISYLLEGYVRQTLSHEEHVELNNWVEASDENYDLFEEMTEAESIGADLAKMRRLDEAKAYKRIRKKISFQKEKSFIRFWPYAVAASLVIVAAAGYFLTVSKVPPPVAVQQTTPSLHPGTDKAVLILGDGRKVVLEDVSNGSINDKDGAKVIKNDSGQIVYSNESSLLVKPEYHMLSTPKGGQYSVTLSDGTKVWLNAASTLRFPSFFDGNERVVEVEGEAYFEVTHNASKPFYVRSNEQEIKVLGTSFNLEVYADEQRKTTTLIEGKVKVDAYGISKELRPGEEGIVADKMILVQAANVKNAIAWKEGMFRFRDERLERILSQVARWYDAEIRYDGKINHRFNGDISRKLPVHEVLNLLEKTGRVHFEVKNKTIIVRP